jgi:hypothetical protein
MSQFKPQDEPISIFRDNSDNAINSITGFASTTSKRISNTFKGMKEDVIESLNDFSNKSVLEASTDFLSSNSILAKFVFIIFILFCFMVILNVGMHAIGYFMTPTNDNPMLINGTLSGSDGTTIIQNPANNGSKTIFRSNNQVSGAEFTWSSWLFFNTNTNTDNNLYHVFSKGDGKRTQYEGDYEFVKISNAPGMYSKTDTSGNTQLVIMMDVVSSTPEDNITINNLPLKKWVHVTLRLQNKILDVYVNGVVSARKILDYVPRQNYHNVTVGGGSDAQGGFKGSISNLQYFTHALTVFEINNIVMKGPNTNSSNLSSDSKANSGNYSYLANQWYKNAS